MSDSKAKRAQKGEKVGDEQNAISRRQKKAREDIKAVQTTPTDEEVEEFFAILRRINASVRQLKRSDGNRNLPGEDRRGSKDVIDGEKLTENDRESDGVKAEGKNKEDMKQNMGFDLNAYPEFDSA